MRQIKVTCDACGKTSIDKEFEAPPNGTFHHSMVEIKFDLSESHLDTMDKLQYSDRKLDLCGKCAEKFRRLLLNFFKGY
jgi:hypothetical protein